LPVIQRGELSLVEENAEFLATGEVAVFLLDERNEL
jgi:hypothetical protein